MTDKNIENLLEAFDNGWATMSYDDENVVLVRAEMLKLVTNLMSDAKKKNALIKELADTLEKLKSIGVECACCGIPCDRNDGSKGCIVDELDSLIEKAKEMVK